MHDLSRLRRIYSFAPSPAALTVGPVDFNAIGDKFIFTPAAPVDIYRWGYVTYEAQDPDAGGFVIALDKRITAGSDTGRVEQATITRADAEVTGAGKEVYNRVVLPVAEVVSGDGSKFNVGPNGPLHLSPGEEAVIEVTNAVGAASTGVVFIEYADLAFEQADTDAIAETV